MPTQREAGAWRSLGRHALRPPGLIALVVLLVDVIGGLLILPPSAVVLVALAGIAGFVIGWCAERWKHDAE